MGFEIRFSYCLLGSFLGLRVCTRVSTKAPKTPGTIDEISLCTGPKTWREYFRCSMIACRATVDGQNPA